MLACGRTGRLAEAQAALDARNQPYRADDSSKERVAVKLGKAEKAVERFVSRKLQPAVQKVIGGGRGFSRTELLKDGASSFFTYVVVIVFTCVGLPLGWDRAAPGSLWLTGSTASSP